LGAIYYGPQKMLQTWDWYVDRFKDQPVLYAMLELKMPSRVQPDQRGSDYTPPTIVSIVRDGTYSVGDLAQILNRSHASVGASIRRLKKKGRLSNEAGDSSSNFHSGLFIWRLLVLAFFIFPFEQFFFGDCEHLAHSIVEPLKVCFSGDVGCWQRFHFAALTILSMVASDNPCFFSFFATLTMGSRFFERLPADDEEPFVGLGTATLRIPARYAVT